MVMANRKERRAQEKNATKIRQEMLKDAKQIFSNERLLGMFISLLSGNELVIRRNPETGEVICTERKTQVEEGDKNE